VKSGSPNALPLLRQSELMKVVSGVNAPESRPKPRLPYAMKPICRSRQ
jgi:hypothetical protein